MRSLYKRIDDEFDRIDIVGNIAGAGHTAYGIELGLGIQMTPELPTEASSRRVLVNPILPA